MQRRTFFTLSGGLMAAAGLLGRAAQAGQKKPGMADLYAACAKACETNAKSCQACATHCAGMVKAGMKEHEKSLRISTDCADICATGQKIISRKGPLSPAIAEACIKACTACRAECVKYPTMKPMADCAKDCERCIAACKALLAAKPAA